MSGKSDALHYRKAVELAIMIRSKEISCTELLEHFLARCGTYNDELNAIIVWKVDDARARARAADEALVRVTTGLERRLLGVCLTSKIT